MEKLTTYESLLLLYLSLLPKLEMKYYNLVVMLVSHSIHSGLPSQSSQCCAFALLRLCASSFVVEWGLTHFAPLGLSCQRLKLLLRGYL